MSLLKRQKRASSTHHGHQRDKTKWNPTAARRHPSSRLSSLLFSSPLLSSPLLSFRHPFLVPLSTLLSWPRLPAAAVCAIFFPLPLFFPPLRLFALTVFGATPHPFQPSPLSRLFLRVFFLSFWILFYFLALTSFFPFFFLFFSGSLSVSIQSARLRILSKEQAGGKHGDKERERERERERESRKRARKPFTRGRSERSVHRTSQHSVSLSQFLDRPAVLNAIFKNAGRPGRVIALWQRRPEACAILYGFAFEGRECWTCQRFLWSSAKDTYAGCSGFLSLCFTLSLPVFFYLPPCSLRSFFLSSFNSRFLHCRTRLEDRLDDYSSVFTPPSIAISRYLFAFTPLFQWHLPKGNVRGSN